MPVILPATAEGYQHAAEVLSGGGVVVLPTDTVYGLAARADLSDAVRIIYKLKARSSGKLLPVCVTGVEQAAYICNISPLARQLMSEFWPGPLTLVVPSRKAAGTLALRCPNVGWVRAFADSGFDNPLVLTSANISGEKPPDLVSDIRRILAEQVDLILDGGRALSHQPSTILRVEKEQITLLRPGALTGDKLAKYVIAGVER